jgi:hypothetical protein
MGSRGSSGSIVSGYGLDDRAIEVRSPAGAKDFLSSLCVQTGSGAHPASCTMGTGGPFSVGKARPGRDADHSHPSSVGAIPPLPQAPPWRVTGLLYLLIRVQKSKVAPLHAMEWLGERGGISKLIFGGGDNSEVYYR